MYLQEIFERIENGKLLLPNFQRKFVWERDSQRKLIASVLTKVPSPSTLIVEQTDSETKFLCKPIGRTKKAIASERNSISYLLDGQQRYTTLFFAFKDQFGKGRSIDEVTYSEIYDKLKNRWFLKLADIDSSGSQIFRYNFDNLVFDTKDSENYLPEDIIDFIEYKKDIKSELRYYSILKDDEYESLISGCRNESHIPLQLFMSDSKYLISKLLYQIGQNRFQKFFDTENRKHLVSSLSSILSSEKVDFMIQELDKGSEGIIEQISTHGAAIIGKWSSKLEDFLSTSINQYDIKQIELKDISKAIATFGYINREGTKLSTFDLLCAKAEDFDLRGKIIEQSLKKFHFFKRGTWEPTEEYKLYNEFGFLKKSKTIEAVYSDYLFQCFNLIHAHDNSRELSTNVLKQKYALDNMNKDFLSSNYIKATGAIFYAGAILNEFCGHDVAQRITNKLAVIPLLNVLIQIPELTTPIIKKLIAFYWIKLFTGNYNSHQNKNSIDDCKELSSWIIDGNQEIKIRLLDLLDKKVLNKPEFATFEMLSNPKSDDKFGYVNKSVSANIFYYILSRGSEVEDWHPSENSVKLNKETIINIHHIIPLASATTIGQGTKQYRNKNNHILDATLNKTPISESANKLISSFTLSEYGEKLSSFAKNDHMITDAWSTYKYSNNSDPSELLSLYKSRYDLLLHSIKTELKTYIES